MAVLSLPLDFRTPQTSSPLLLLLAQPVANWQSCSEPAAGLSSQFSFSSAFLSSGSYLWVATPTAMLNRLPHFCALLGLSSPELASRSVDEACVEAEFERAVPWALSSTSTRLPADGSSLLPTASACKSFCLISMMPPSSIVVSDCASENSLNSVCCISIGRSSLIHSSKTPASSNALMSSKLCSSFKSGLTHQSSKTPASSKAALLSSKLRSNALACRPQDPKSTSESGLAHHRKADIPCGTLLNASRELSGCSKASIDGRWSIVTRRVAARRCISFRYLQSPFRGFVMIAAASASKARTSAEQCKMFPGRATNSTTCTLASNVTAKNLS
mmetsp:Transcript_60780/g.114776  ORF Transcript_60780/g.114776 Transcript_60780/m.114776 type:complete len:331 (-) Transcript_60780:158-1150(-)